MLSNKLVSDPVFLIVYLRFERYAENDLAEYNQIDAPDVYGHLFPEF